MSDLISRKEAIEAIESLCIDGKMYGNDNITLIDAYEAIDKLGDIPTAYDVDKVVEELKEECANIMNRRFSEDKYNMHSKGAQAMLLKTENIVKGAVKDE